MRGLWAAALALLPGVALAQMPVNDQRALAAVDACIARLDPDADVGYARIVARCPELTRRLEQSSLGAWLPRGWKEARNDLSAGSLIELRSLAARELTLSAAKHFPSVAHLQAVLTRLGPAAQQRSTLWMRFRSWLRSVLERNAEAEREGWLTRMIRRQGTSQTVVELLTYASLALVLMLALGIILNELRAAGWLGKRAQAATMGLQSDPRRAPPVSWRDVERAPLAGKPGLLLQLIVAKLGEQKRVDAASALTVHELTQSAELPAAEDRERLRDLAGTAERLRYAAAAPQPAAIEVAVQRGRELLERLSKVPEKL